MERSDENYRLESILVEDVSVDQEKKKTEEEYIWEFEINSNEKLQVFYRSSKNHKAFC